MRPLITIAALLGYLPQSAHAGNCYQQAVKSYAAPYYVQKAQVYYYVGQNIRAAAVVEAEKRSDPEWQEFQQFKQFRTEWQAFKQQQAQPADALPQQAPQTQLQASCVRCHSGESPKGDRDFSGPLTPDDLKAIREQLKDGSMPPKNSPEGKAMTNEMAGAVLLEAIDALEGEAFDDPPPLPPPQEELQPPSEP